MDLKTLTDINPASPKVKFNDVFCYRPSFMRTFGLPRFDRAQPFFPSPSSSPSFLDIGPQCTPNLLISEPRIVTENYIGSMLILPWTPLETVDAWFDSTIFSITFRLQPLMGLFNLQRKATKTDVPELLHSHFAAVPFKKMHMIFLKINTEEMVPRVSRSVHARLTVIVGLLPVIVRLLGVGSRSVHASNFGLLTVHIRCIRGGSGPGFPMDEIVSSTQELVNHKWIISEVKGR